MDIVNEPKVSIVIPVKNGATYLEFALKSALEQHYSNFEIIVGVNPSQDSTISIAKSILGRNHPGIFEFEDEVNMPANFNRSGLKASGDYIKFLCHDDVLHPDSIKKLISEFSASEDVILASSYENYIDTLRPPRGPESLGSQRQIGRIRLLNRFSKYGNWLCGPSGVMIRSKTFQKLSFDENLPCAFDLDYWIRLSQLGHFRIFPDYLYSSRIHKHQASNVCHSGGFLQDLKVISDRYRSSTNPVVQFLFKIRNYS